MTVSAHDWVEMELCHGALLQDGLAHVQLNVAIVARNVDGLVWVAACGGRRC